ncbi:MAG: hypothetical protein NZM03_12970 [Limisphaera sp.]|nr:hypothetical protein [Limisphaera sp.]
MNFTSQGFSFGQLDTSPDAAWQSAENLLQSIMHRLAVDCIVGLTIAMVARAQYHSVKNFPRSRAK